MTIYHLEIYNEGIILKIRSLFEIMPVEIELFIKDKIQNKVIYINKETVMIGNQFKINWTYYYNDDIIHIRYKLYHCNIKIKKENTCRICLFC